MQDGHMDVHTYCMDKTLCPLMPSGGGIKMQLIQELNLVTANMDIYTNVDLLYNNGGVISIRMQRSRCEMR